jgi:hypothetical protein
MADSSIKVVIDTTDALNLGTPDSTRTVMQPLRNWLKALIGGSKRANSVSIWADGAKPVRASGTFAYATSSGTVGIVINGVTITVTWASSDIASMTATVAAINASTNALVQYLVTACNFAGTATLTSVGTTNKVSIFGYDFTAVAGGVLAPDQFDQSGTDTADAASLAAQINLRPGLNRLVVATSSSNVVTIRQVSGTTKGGAIASAASTIVCVDNAAVATGMITCLHPGTIGNAITTAATGTNVTASGARLISGAGGNVTPIVFDA